MSNRREFLKNAAGAAAGAFFAGSSRAMKALAAPQQSAPRGKRREISVGGRRVKTIDIHCHTNPDIRDLLQGREKEAQLGFSQPDHPMFLSPAHLDARLRDMNEHGIDIHAVCLGPEYNYWADRDLSSRIVERQNEKIMEMCTAHPDRFVGLAALSLQHPDLAAEQMETAKKMGMRGFGIGASVNGEELSSPKFDPFWAKVEQLGMLVFMHPGGEVSGIQKRFQGTSNLSNVIGNPLSTTIALSRLIFDGTLDRFPGIKLVASHGGGYLTSYLGRSNHCMEKNPTDCKPTKKEPSEYFKQQLYVDTVVFRPEGVRHLVAEVGVGHVMFGTDYPADLYPPHMGDDREADLILETGLSAADQRAILGENVGKLLGIPPP